MGMDEGEAHRGWKRRNDTVEDLSSWFCQLSTQDRLQAVAVEDVVWIRLFNILYRKHKSWMRQQGTPPTWDRDKVRKLYDRLQRNERNRVAAAAAAAASAPSDAALSQGGARAPPPSFVPPPCVVSPVVVAETAPGEVEPAAAAAAGKAGLANGDAPAAGAPICGPFPSDAPRETGVCCRGGGGGGGGGQSPLQVGERLSDAVRLCSSAGAPRPGGGGSGGGVSVGVGAAGGEGEGGGSLCALTLSEAELSRPRRLLDDLRFMTSRPAEEAAAGGNGVEGAQSKPPAATAAVPPTPPTPVGQRAGFLSLALAEEELGRADALALGDDPLMETGWLAERFPKVTLGDLLANRLELSLWASYWNRRRPRESVGRTSASPLACAAQEADNLRGYWRALPLQQRRHFLEGLPDAAALAGDSGDGTAMSSCSGGGKVDLVQNLMLAPVAWCFKDDGAAVRHVVESLRRACADRSSAGLEATPAADEAPAMEKAASSDGSNTGSGGGGDDFAIDSATNASTAGVAVAVAVAAGEGGSAERKKKKKKKNRKKQKNGSVAAAAADLVAAGSPVSSIREAVPPGAGGVAAHSDDNGSGGEDASATLEAKAAEADKTEGGDADGSSTSSSARGSGNTAPSPTATAVAAAVADAVTEVDDGWVVSTSRRSKPKEAKEEVREVRRGGGGGGGKGGKGKDGGGHPKATAGHRESLRDSHRESYRDRGDAPARGSKSAGVGEGWHDRGDTSSSAPWARGASRQDSAKDKDDGRAWGKDDSSSRDRREEEGGDAWTKSGSSHRERRDSAAAGGGPGLSSGSAAWPRAGARKRDDKDAETSWLKGGGEDAGPWAKRGGNSNSARENGHNPTAGRSAKDPQHTRTRSSSFADMVRGAQASNAGEGAPGAVSPLRKSNSVKVPTVVSNLEATTPAWGSGKTGGAPSFATVLLGGSGAAAASNKPPPPPALKPVDMKVSASAVSPATTVSASPVAAPEAGGWNDPPAAPVPAASGPKPAAPKPMAWTTGNTAGVLRAALGEPASRNTTTTSLKSQKDQAPAPAGSEDAGPGKGLHTTQKDGSGGGGGGRRSPRSGGDGGDGASPPEGKAGEVRDVMVEVLDLVGDVIVRRAHSRASKAKSYAQVIAKSEGRAHALATAYQRNDGLLKGSWEDESSGTKHAAGASDATDSVASTASATAETPESSPAVGAEDSGAPQEEDGEGGGSNPAKAVPVLALSPNSASAAVAGGSGASGGAAKEPAAEAGGDAPAAAAPAAGPSAPPADGVIAAGPRISYTSASQNPQDENKVTLTAATRAANGPVAAAAVAAAAESASDHAAPRASGGRHSSISEPVIPPRPASADAEPRRPAAASFEGGGGGKPWSDRDRGPGRGPERGSNAASWTRGNTPPAAVRAATRRGGGDAGRAWMRSGQQQQALGGGGGGGGGGGVSGGNHAAGPPMNDLRGARSRPHKPLTSQQHGIDTGEEGRGGPPPPLPRAPTALRTSMSVPLGREGAVDVNDALSRGLAQPDMNVIPSPRVLRSPSRHHRPRSSSAGSGTRHPGMPGGAGGGYYAYPQQQQQESWQNGSDWTLSAAGLASSGGAPRGVRSGGGGGGGGNWQHGRDGDVGRAQSQYPYRDENNLYRASSPHAGGGGGGGGRHSRQEQGGHHRRGSHTLARPSPSEAQQQQQQQHQQQQQQQQQHQPQQQQQHQQQQQPARFRSRSGGAGSELSMGDRRAERMEYEYNLMVSCLDRNVERFMQKLGRAMRPRRRAWSQVIARVRELVAGIWEEAKVEMYGSCFTGLELPSSDVDVVVCGINGLKYSYGGSRAGYSSMQTVANLQKLANVLQEQSWVRGMKVIETAAVPVIKILADPVSNGNGQFMFDDGGGGGGRDGWLGGGSGLDYIPLDISFESPQHGGIASSKWVRDCIQGGKYGFALPAVMVLKEVLCQRGLNQPWSGGLSSYSLINMMITVLQRAEVERARARRIVACAQAAAAHAAARGVRPIPVAVPLLPGQVAVAPQQPGVMGPPLPPPPPPPPPPMASEATQAHRVDASDQETQRQEATVSVSDQQVDGGGGDATISGASASASTSGSAAGDPRPPSPDKGSASGDILPDGAPPASTDKPCGGGKSDSVKSNGNDTGNGASAATEASPTGVDGEGRQDPVPPVSDAAGAADDEQKPPPALSLQEKPLSSSPSLETTAAAAAAAAAGGDDTSSTGAGVVVDQTAHPAAAAAAAAEVPAVENVGPTRAPTPPVAPATGAVAAAPAVMFPVQAGQQQQQQQQQQGAAMLPSAAQQAQYNLGMNADLFHMKHMEINLSQEEVERADLSGMTPGEVLVRFLAFFGRQFDPSRVGISVGRGALNNPFALSPSVDPRTGMPVMDAHLVIEDPLDRDQNVARSCFGFPQVQWLFGQCLSVLQERGADMAEFDRDADLLQMLLYY